MRAIAHRQYGGPEVLQLLEWPKPVPQDHEVVVRVRAASLNAADYRLMRADPFLARLENGLFGPKKWPVLGADFAGIVDSVGASVTRLSVGDRVFGYSSDRATFADYVCVPADHAEVTPESLSCEAASSIPLAGITALQALETVAQVQAGETVLVYGAGGGVGFQVVQLALAMGAEVTAVCGPNSAPVVRGFGAHRVIDYTTADVAASGLQFDVTLAVNGHRTPWEYKRWLKPHGRHVTVGGTNRQIFEGLLLAPLVFLFGSRRAATLHVNPALIPNNLQTLRRYLDAGILHPSIDRTYPMAEVKEAMTYVENGHVRGKVVLVGSP